MQIDLDKKLTEHLTRVENLAKEAEKDIEESYSSRASALTAMTRIISDMTQTQEKIFNMKRLMEIESITIETVKEFLTPEQHTVFLEKLTERLGV